VIRYIGCSYFVTTNNYTTLKITVTVTQKIKFSASVYLVVASTIETSNDESWGVSTLEFSIWICGSRTELALCGPNTDHEAEHSIVLCYSPLPWERVTISGQRLDSYQRKRCCGNVFQQAFVTETLCLLSRCSSTDVWLWLHYSGFQASRHNVPTNHLWNIVSESVTKSMETLRNLNAMCRFLTGMK
jgi:hypothetical protein